MALVKMGGGVIQMSGSIAGNTFARNRFGNYVRSRTKPVNPGTALQNNVRDCLSYLTNRWSATLTAGNRIAWASYAAAITMKNRLGETVYLTGFNHFVRSNVEMKNRSLTVTDAGPTAMVLPAKDPTFTVTASVATQLVSVAFDNARDWAIAVGGYMFVYMGVPRGQTRNFFNGPWRYMNKIAGAVIPPTTPSTMAPPYTLVLGQLITCYGRIRLVDGSLSEPFTASCTVAA